LSATDDCDAKREGKFMSSARSFVRANEKALEVAMNVRIVVSLISALLLSHCAIGQTKSQAAGDGTSFKQDVLHQIALLQQAAREDEAANAGDIKLGRIYSQLGLYFEDTAQWDRSEAALKHAVSLFRHAREKDGELAATIDQLGCLYVTTGRLREAEREEQEALKLREALNDRLQIARSWVDLAALYLAKNKADKARDFAQEALAEFEANRSAAPFDRVSARYTLALAFCSTKNCPAAIPVMKDAIEEARANLQPKEFPIGFGEFILGYAYWKSGNMGDAGLYLRRGTAAMAELLGWGHPSYVAALRKYAQYLREDKDMEAANVVERQIRQVEAVVDVHSIQSGQATFGFVGLR
jgi:tetratricopeptide (TPR) repeat protein